MNKTVVGEMARFGGVGVLATLTHAFIFWIGLSFGLFAFLANGLAFCVALGVTYWGQRLVVFGRAPVAGWRFFVVALAGLALHVLGMSALVAMGLGPWAAWLALTLLVPAMSFLASRLWVFGNSPSPL